MSHLLRAVLVMALLVGLAGSAPVSAAPVPPGMSAADADPESLSVCDPDGTQASGAVYRICMPPDWWWNGDLVIYAHGYVSFQEPVGIPEDQLCLPEGGPCISDIVNTLGYAFATTSYSVNGLAVPQGLADVADLVTLFGQQYGEPDRVLLVGVSEGGLVTTLAVEQRPDLFQGGLAACGPVGDFNRQVSYLGDFRVAFDYFFPGLLPGSPVDIPPSLIDTWDQHYLSVVRPALFDPTNAAALRQLIQVTGLPYDPRNWMETVEESIQDALWYNVFATNDASEKLGGQPFGNQHRYYRGSDNDWRLNQEIQRFASDPAALDEIEAHYQTSGQLAVPLITLHTLRDQQVPYQHEVLYRLKTWAAGNVWRHINRPVNHYGHCNFSLIEVLAAFGLLVFRTTGEPLNQQGLEKLLPDPGARGEFQRLLEAYQDPAAQAP